MKRLTVIVVGLALTAAVSADVPQMINYQGRLNDVTGIPVPDAVFNRILKERLHQHGRDHQGIRINVLIFADLKIEFLREPYLLELQVVLHHAHFFRQGGEFGEAAVENVPHQL